MRSSSIKSLTATATLIATLTLAVAPAAQAATATERAKRTVTRFMQRIASIVSNGLPGDPIPLSSPLRDDETTTTTNTPKKSR